MAIIDIRWVTLIEISWFSKSPLLRLAYLPPATKLGQGYVFTGVCDSVHRGVCLSACWDTTPREQTPPEQTPPRSRTPPRRRACWEIRSMRGRYASYWNAILFFDRCLLSSFLPNQSSQGTSPILTHLQHF